MASFMPRFRRRIDRNNWVPIGEGNHDPAARNGSSAASARLDGPPDLDHPIGMRSTSTPTYARARGWSGSSSIISDFGQRGVARPTLGSPKRSNASTARIVDLEDIRHDERCISMDNRLSSVPSYPVFLDTSDQIRSRRRSSMASTNTAGILLSVGSMPGSEPFDENAATSSYAAQRCTALDSHPPLSPLVSPLSPFEASVAHVMTVRRVGVPIRATTTLANFRNRLIDLPPSAHHLRIGLRGISTQRPILQIGGTLRAVGIIHLVYQMSHL